MGVVINVPLSFAGYLESKSIVSCIFEISLRSYYLTTRSFKTMSYQSKHFNCVATDLLLNLSENLKSTSPELRIGFLTGSSPLKIDKAFLFLTLNILLQDL